MTPDQYAAAPRCRTCGRTAHAGMALERIFAAAFNGTFAVLSVAVGHRPEASRD